MHAAPVVPRRTPSPQTARLYDATGAPRGVFVHPAPLLDCCFESEGVFYTAGLDARVTRCAARREAAAMRVEAREGKGPEGGVTPRPRGCTLRGGCAKAPMPLAAA